jgi:hypothetical protein
VVIGACDRKGLERLCRYIARPPLAKSRLETRNDGTVVIRLKQPWADGTGAIQLSRLDLPFAHYDGLQVGSVLD